LVQPTEELVEGTVCPVEDSEKSDSMSTLRLLKYHACEGIVSDSVAQSRSTMETDDSSYLASIDLTRIKVLLTFEQDPIPTFQF